MGTTTALLAVLILATSVWLGGYVAIAVVARTSSTVLGPAQRVVFFRALGRSYFWVGAPALTLALASGGLLARDVERGALFCATVGTAVLLLVSFGIAVAQARRMTRMRLRLADAPGDPSLEIQTRRGARSAAGLRALLGVLSLVLVVQGCLLAT